MEVKKNSRAIADEIANDKQFQDCRDRRGAIDVSMIAMPRNTQATGSGIVTSAPLPDGRLLGRVHLAVGSEGLESYNFYIGPGRARFEELGFSEEDPAKWEVFSWAAPVASAFYTGHYSGPGIEMSAGVIRTIHGLGSADVVIDDDYLLPAIEPIFPSRELTIPAPPMVPKASPKVEPNLVDHEKPQMKPGERQASQKADEVSASAQGLEPIRGRNVLNVVMQAPRKEQLDAQVATLQSRQYELITRPASESQLIQGNPGTGKTIVAAHRVAYLLDPSAEENRLSEGKVMLVGPSVAYTNHVRKILLDLVPEASRDRYVLTSIEEVFRNLLGEIPIESFAPNQAPKSAKSFDPLIFDIANCAAENFKEDYEERFLASLSGSSKKSSVVVPLRELSPTRRAQRCYDYFRNFNNARKVLEEVTRASIHDDEATPEELEESIELHVTSWIPWVESLPEFDSLSNQPDQQWLIALMAWNLDLENESAVFNGIEHVIVDEAQDLYPVEWSFLKSLNLTGAWTVVGDFNQQSSVHGFKSWKLIGKQLGIGSPPQVLDLGYRSTSGIMALANSVIGKAAAPGESIQLSSELPIAIKVYNGKELAIELEKKADEFAQKYEGGMTAAIIPPANIALFRKVLEGRGWRQNGSETQWMHLQRPWSLDVPLTVGTPQELRGLEYDAVILMQPSEMPSSQQMFMAITRANRELVIIHSNALPAAIHKFMRPSW